MTNNSTIRKHQSVSITKQFERLAESQAEIVQHIDNLANQNAFIRMQLAQVAESVARDTAQFKEGADALRSELKKLQSGSAQGAMAALFSKLFRQCIEQLNHLDALLITSRSGERTEAEKPWISALGILQDGFTQLLCDWGCTPIVIREGETQFDPDIHESVPSAGEEIPPDIQKNIIVRVCRRGWKLNTTIIQFPQVIVA
jgi:molecular chaperone GrpE (heat shock protein)